MTEMKKKTKINGMKFPALFLLYVFGFFSASAQEGYLPAKENLVAREWFQDAKFGMFIHWGVYSVMGGGGDKGIAEWIMEHKRIPVSNYEKLASFFNPVDFDAKQWVQIAKEAGMKYITITSKHHDGFAMFNSKVSEYNIVKATRYGEDVIKMLAEECEKEGIKLFFYYSQLDWHHPDYFPPGNTGKYTGRELKGNWLKYLKYMNDQLAELLTSYGPVGGIWFDGMWDKIGEDWRLGETYSLIHRLQPQALIGSNHHLEPFAGEDFQMFEKDLPGRNTAGFNTTFISDKLPLETCETINGSWGFNINDNAHKSRKNLIQYVVKAAGNNSNFLLNVGPMPNGKIQEEHVTRLKQMGEWLKKNGETIYGTRGVQGVQTDQLVATEKSDKIYVHVLERNGNTVLVDGLKGKVSSATLFGTNRNVKYAQNDFGLMLQLPDSDWDDIDTIIQLTVKK